MSPGSGLSVVFMSVSVTAFELSNISLMSLCSLQHRHRIVGITGGWSVHGQESWRVGGSQQHTLYLTIHGH